jgi:hypothetical protein
VQKDKLLRRLLKDRFTVTLRGGQSFDGLLADADKRTVRLVDAFALDGKNRVSVDGDLYLPRREIVYMQRPGATA